MVSRTHSQFILAALIGLLLFLPSVSFAATKGKPLKKAEAAAASIALRFAEALSRGDAVETARVTFKCVDRLIALQPETVIQASQEQVAIGQRSVFRFF